MLYLATDVFVYIIGRGLHGFDPLGSAHFQRGLQFSWTTLIAELSVTYKSESQPRGYLYGVLLIVRNYQEAKILPVGMFYIYGM